MKEAEIIHEAYASDLKASYTRFGQAWWAAAGDQALQEQAEQEFRLALQKAKKIKERALAVVLSL